MLPLQPHLSRKYQKTGMFHPKGGISLQSTPKKEIKIRYLIFAISYTNTIMSKLFFFSSQYFHFMVAKHASFLGRTFVLETNSIQ